MYFNILQLFLISKQFYSKITERDPSGQRLEQLEKQIKEFWIIANI